MNVLGCVRDSSNVCMVMISQDLGRDPMVRYLDAFGYGKQTGVDFPGEVKGTVNLPRSCSSCPASAAIGYSLSVSPLQMASVYSIIANGGVRLEPRLVSSIVNEHGVIISTEGASERVISEETARLVRLMLKSVVDSGTGVAAAIPGYTVGGKTGTAEKVVNGRYDPEKRLCSFTGVFPIHDPRYALVVMLDEPKGLEETLYFATAAWNAVPAAGRLIPRIGPILGVPAAGPDSEAWMQQIVPASWLPLLFPEEEEGKAA